MKLLITGGAGFIGSNFIRYILHRNRDAKVVNLDKLTYAGNLENLTDINETAQFRERYEFVRGDIADGATINKLIAKGIDAVVNFAAETHVDRSLENAAPFLHTNVVGTHVLLEAARVQSVKRFLHISTDEVYGPTPAGTSFTEETVLRPSNPYAASKASADLLAAAYGHSYRLPIIIVRCSNNYGPYQFPEKLIPLAIGNALEDKPVPVYGDGLHERTWLYVEDACRAIALLLEQGIPGETYNAGGTGTRANLDVVRAILRELTRPDSLIQFVEDRPGHDRRYALNSNKIRALGWEPQVNFETGIHQTIAWYRSHAEWLTRRRSGEYREYYARHYKRRNETLQKLAPSRRAQ